MMAIAVVHESRQGRDGHRGLIAWVHAAMPIIEAAGDTSMMGTWDCARLRWDSGSSGLIE